MRISDSLLHRVPSEVPQGPSGQKIVEELKAVSLQIQDRYHLEIERLGCDGDHVHLLCGSHPKYSPGQVVRVYKSVTARELFARVPGLRKELWGGEFWSDGYFVATVGEKYVREQGSKKVESLQMWLF